MQAKFSMEFTLAVIALERRAGLADFTDDTLRRLDVQDMMGRIAYAAYESAGPDFTNVTTLIDVDLADGRTLSGRADYAHGSTRSPMGFDDIAEKFRQCAAYGGHGDEKSDRIIGLAAALDRAPAIDDLVGALRR